MNNSQTHNGFWWSVSSSSLGWFAVSEFVTFNFSVIKLHCSNSQTHCKVVYMSDEIICVPVVHGADDALSGSAVRSFGAFGALSAGTHNFQD
jgi:hypothetical protein